MNNNLTVLSNNSTDPSTLGWPATLPLEIALKTASLQEIRDSYGITDDEWAVLKSNEAFRQAILKCQEEAKEDGYSFRAKAKMQAEELLKTSWRLIHDPDTPANVKADLIKFTTRVAGLEPSPKANTDGQPTFAININMGGSGTVPHAQISHTHNHAANPTAGAITFDQDEYYEE